jgi:hypothetical protein
MTNMNSNLQSQRTHVILRTFAVTALLAQSAASTPGQEAAGTALPPSKLDPWEKYLNPGPFQIRPYGWINGYYDNNVLLTGSDTQSDFIWAINPGVTVATKNYQDQQGSYVVLDYLANVFIFTDGIVDPPTQEEEHFGWGQNVNLAGHWAGSKLTLDLAQGYNATFGGLLGYTNRVDREFAGQLVDQQVIPTTFRGFYQISEKTSVEADALQVFRILDDDLNSYTDWAVTPWFNYRVTEKVQTSLGAAMGWRDIRPGSSQTNAPNETYEQVLARVQYQVAAKVNAIASVGVEWDQWQGGLDQGPFAVFLIGANYQPGETTILNLQAYRRQYPSITVAAENYITTGFQASIQQRIWQRLSANLSGGYDYTVYEPSETGISTDRVDNYFFISPSLGYTFNIHWDAGLYFTYRKNDSNTAGDSYDGYQAGFRTSFRF